LLHLKTQLITGRQDEPFMTRDSLLLRVKDKKDEQAWEEFALIYEPFLRALLRKQSIPSSECDDISQEVMMKLYQNIEKYQKQNGAKFRTWLVTVLKNTMFSHLKKRKATQNRDERWAEEKIRQLESNELEEDYETEWQQKICDLAFENIKKKFSGRAIDVFTQTLEEIPVETICKNLELKRDSVYRLRGRVKKALTKEVNFLREQLE